MFKNIEQKKAELRDEIRTIKSLIKSLEDVKQGRVYDMNLDEYCA